MSKISKTSNFTGFSYNVDDYLRNADKDLRNLFDYLNRFPKTYIQAAEPTIESDGMAFWKNSGDNKFYLIKNIDSVQKKIELV